MTKPIERVYVCDPIHDTSPIITGDRSSADSYHSTFGGPPPRVFTEDRPWSPARVPPDSGRKVLAAYARRATMLPTLIVARFGSEGKWVAEDHDMRVTYLDQGTVIGWQEMPVFPEVV